MLSGHRSRSGVFLVSTIAEYHFVLTLVRLLAGPVHTESLARHPLVLLGVACFVVGVFPDLLRGSALWLQQTAMTGPSLMLVGAGALAKTARGSS